MTLRIDKLLPLVDVSRRGHMHFHYAAATFTSRASGFMHLSYNDSCPRYRDFLSRRCHCTSVHAEQRTVTRLFNKIMRNTDGRLSAKDVRRRLRRYKVVTLRSREHQPGYGGFSYDGYDIVSGLPCPECVSFLTRYGFHKIYYTDGEAGCVRQVKLRDMSMSASFSDAQQVYRGERHLRSGKVMSLDPHKYK